MSYLRGFVVYHEGTSSYILIKKVPDNYYLALFLLDYEEKNV